MMDEDTAVEVETAADSLYLAVRYCNLCERLNLDDDLKDKADREFIDARNKAERALGALLARYDVHAVVELHRIEIDGVE